MSEINTCKEMTQSTTGTSSKSPQMDVTGLRRVPGAVPKTALLILLVEVCGSCRISIYD